MGRYLFVLIPLLVVVIGAWVVTSTLELPTAGPTAKGEAEKPATTRRIEPYRSPLPIVDPSSADPRAPPSGSRRDADDTAEPTETGHRPAGLPWRVLLALERLQNWSLALPREVHRAREAVIRARGSLPTHYAGGKPIPPSARELWLRRAEGLLDPSASTAEDSDTDPRR